MKKEFVRDCQVETDLEILIPDDYISNITERLSLYKELDSLETEHQLGMFRVRMQDRFGEVPEEVGRLFDIIRLRWQARKVGFEKIVLKNQRFVGYFISKEDSPYYQSDIFSAVLEFVKANPVKCRMKESNGRLSIAFQNINNVSDALRVLKPLHETISQVI
jgi:transcription-repair coupling factor (superfamily II helicase)